MAEGDGAEVERRRPAAAKRRAEIENMSRESLTPTCYVHARCEKLRVQQRLRREVLLQVSAAAHARNGEGGGVEILKQDFGFFYYLSVYGFQRLYSVLGPPPRFNKSLFQFHSCVVPPVDA